MDNADDPHRQFTGGLGCLCLASVKGATGISSMACIAEGKVSGGWPPGFPPRSH